MFWHLLHYSMAGGEWYKLAKENALYHGWTTRQVIGMWWLATFVNITISLAIAFTIIHFFIGTPVS